MTFAVFEQTSRTILSKVSGFLAEAGFTHSLTPARNCTFGCTYCYVPTMRVRAGLKPEDWHRWGQRTTFKANAAALLDRELRADQTIYCSPLTDPYQPAEEQRRLMPGILEAVRQRPPHRFVIQTRGPLIERDIDLLRGIEGLRVSFSLTTDDDAVRRRFEPHCAPIEERLRVMRRLREEGIVVFATLAPLLPCDPEWLAALALDVTGADLIGDPLHVRSVKPTGATTRDAALNVLAHHQEQRWLDPEFQLETIARIAAVATVRGLGFFTGPAGFGRLKR